MSKNSTSIWTIYFWVFLTLGSFHFYRSFQDFPNFQPLRSGSVGGVTIVDGLEKFSDQLNEYVSEYNGSNRWANIAAAVGYYLAAVIALASRKSEKIGEERWRKTLRSMEEIESNLEKEKQDVDQESI